MRIAVGSGNPVKRDAVQAALSEATVESVAVESGVSEQPWGDETIQGARNRAERALGDDHDLAVGLEGGVAEQDAGLFLIMWRRRPTATRPRSAVARAFACQTTSPRDSTTARNSVR
jgi:non-canonical (house-cleaning) NTP pyrophosphatase